MSTFWRLRRAKRTKKSWIRNVVFYLIEATTWSDHDAESGAAGCPGSGCLRGELFPVSLRARISTCTAYDVRHAANAISIAGQDVTDFFARKSVLTDSHGPVIMAEKA
jgi:hypothetical protein